MFRVPSYDCFLLRPSKGIVLLRVQLGFRARGAFGASQAVGLTGVIGVLLSEVTSCLVSATSQPLGQSLAVVDSSTWRFMGSYKWCYKSPNIGYNYSCPTYNYP